MKNLFKIDIPDFKEFMVKRSEIQRLYFLALCFAYMTAYVVLLPHDTPIYSVAISLVATPLFVFAFYLRASTFYFVNNWLYILYLTVASGMFIFTLYLLSDYRYEHNYVFYELTHLFLAAAVGFSSAVIVSIPFKMIQTILFDTEFYETVSYLQSLEDKAFPEKMTRDVEKKKENFKYDTLNETQLQVELNNAVREDRFEDAEAIRKILEKKFK